MAMLAQNESPVDRIVRVVVGILLMILGFGVISGIWGVVLGVVGLIPLLTGAVGFCPLYTIIGMSTKK
jgi:hypothetical protein